MQAAGDRTSKACLQRDLGLQGVAVSLLALNARSRSQLPSMGLNVRRHQGSAGNSPQPCLGTEALLTGTAQNHAREATNNCKAPAIIPRQRPGLALLLLRLLRQTKPEEPERSLRKARSTLGKSAYADSASPSSSWITVSFLLLTPRPPCPGTGFTPPCCSSPQPKAGLKLAAVPSGRGQAARLEAESCRTASSCHFTVRT